MNYIELKEKLQKTLDILGDKQWPDIKKLERTAMSLIGDFWKANNLPPSKIEPSRICLRPTDFPDELKCLFTYHFTFKSDKRKPDGNSDQLSRVVLEPVLEEKLWTCDIEKAFEHINQYTAILRSQQHLLEEKEQLLRKIDNINKELEFIEESLKKY